MDSETLEVLGLGTEPLQRINKAEARSLADYLNKELDKTRRAGIRDHRYELGRLLEQSKKPYQSVRTYLKSIYGTKRTKRMLLVYDCPFEDLPLHMGDTFYMVRAVLVWRLNLCK